MNRIKQLFLSIALLPVMASAQQEKSAINWSTGLTWQQVKAKAKKENKYIFVDCYATWCKPCLEMEQKVYTVDSVGSFLNAGFISVKLQMDQTRNDNADVKSWYKTAKEIEKQYRIAAYPSYVFFAPGGEVVSKAIGYKEPASFIQTVKDVTDPSKQYFPLLEKYKQGKLDHAGTVSLIKLAQQVGDTADYHQVLNSYCSYLHKQKRAKLFTRENIEFAASTLDNSKQILFDMFYPDSKEVNRVMKTDWYAKKVVDKIIDKEKLQPFFKELQETAEPNWDALYNAIAKDYKANYAGRNLLKAKMDWNYRKDDWLKIAAYANEKMEKYGTDTTDRGDEFKLNNLAAMIFSNLGSTAAPGNEAMKELKRTCAWMEGVARRGATAKEEYRLHQWPLYIDTYANLLYVTGQTAEAIKSQELSLTKANEYAIDKGSLHTIGGNLEKMKKGEPTW